MKILTTLYGVMAFLLVIVVTLLVALSIVLLSIPVYIIPSKRWRHAGVRLLLSIPIYWNDFNKAILWPNIYHKLKIVGSGQTHLKADGHYMMIANHKNWVDIMLLFLVFHRKIPLLKFFMKKQLLWQLPLAGLACFVLGFPFMKRHSRADVRKNPALRNEDIQTTIKACDKFKQHPSTVINFVEGTRFTEKKRIQQKSPYKNLLKPKAGGTSLVLDALRDKLDGFINVTIVYHDHNPSLWDFIAGRFRQIDLHYQVIHLDDALFGDYYNDRIFRVTFQKWLNDLWQENDNLITQLKHDANNDKNH